MREILFRGKRKDNGEWVEGQYYKRTKYYGDPSVKHYIIVSTEDLGFDQALEYEEVIPETVGQFTGLLDINGTKIFEGDVLMVTHSSKIEPYNVVVGWHEGTFVYYDACCYPDEIFCSVSFYGGDQSLFTNEETVVIGNIHDNPELLK